METSMLFVAVVAVMTPLSYTWLASAYTWKETEPLGPASSSRPTDALKRVQLADRVANLGERVRAEPLRVGRAVEGDRNAVSLTGLAVGDVPLDRSPPIRHRGPGDVGEVGRGRAARRRRRCERPADVRSERVAGDVLRARRSALDGRRVARARLEVGTRVERCGGTRVGDGRGDRRRLSLLDECERGGRQRRRIHGLGEGRGRGDGRRDTARAVGRARQVDDWRSRVATSARAALDPGIGPVAVVVVDVVAAVAHDEA